MPEPTRDLSAPGRDAVTANPDSPTADHLDPRRAGVGSRGSPPSLGAPVVPGFELLDEVGRGGMGVVYRTRDVAFGRDVAVKLLQDRFPAGGPAARRFADEARITGQLQHPGIPAAYQTGALADGRPFLAMKLIKGETLDDLIKASGGRGPDDRPLPLRERAAARRAAGEGNGGEDIPSPGPRDADHPLPQGERVEAGAHAPRSPGLIAAFEKVCEAVGYAHAHGVIHRDLKPANVMVGAFGEVQVMDWGLAKVLANGRRQPAGGNDDATAPGTEMQSLRGADELTQAGSLLGTPAYMPPEQAIGAIDRVDRRSDVFSLGAVLCAVLTGRPPYTGDTAEGNRQLAALAKLDDAYARLAGCGADPGLVALCKRCLSPDPADRPADAGAVAAAVAKLRADADERARRAELDRVRAEGEARAQRQKRRTQLAVAAGVFGLLTVGGGAWAAVRSQADARMADADRTASVALGRAEQLMGEAEKLDPGTPAEGAAAVKVWEDALAAVEQAETAVAAGTPEVTERVRERAATVRAGLSKAKRDAALLAALEVVRDTPNDTRGAWPDGAKRVRALRAALAAAGLPSRLPDPAAAADAAATAIRERPGVGAAVRAAIDHELKECDPVDGLHDGFEFAGWLAVAGRLDDDPFRREARAALVAARAGYVTNNNAHPGTTARPGGDPTALLRLADRAAAEGPAADGVVMLAAACRASNIRTDQVTDLLRAARDRHPADADLYLLVGEAAEVVWAGTGDPAAGAEAEGCYRAAVALRPDGFMGYDALAALAAQRGDQAGAAAQYRAAVARSPRHLFLRNNWALALLYAGDWAGAEAVLRETVRLDPTFGVAYGNLAQLQREQGDPAAAAETQRAGHEAAPGDPVLACNYMIALRLGGRTDEARAVGRGWLAGAGKDPPGRGLVEDEMKTVEAWAAVEPKVAAALAGETPGADAAEREVLFRRCLALGRDAAAARQYAALGPTAAATRTLRFDAVGAAARAGCGVSADRLTPADRAALRRQAAGWLKAWLAELRQRVTDASWPERLQAAADLMLRSNHPSVVGLRPGPGRVEMPAAEAAEWDAFWGEVHEVVAIARRPPDPPHVAPYPRPVKP